MALHSDRISIRPWTFHDDEVADQWPPYNDPLEPLWNLPRQYGAVGDVWSLFDGSVLRRTWAVDDARGRLIGRISLREIDTRKAQARLGITFGAPYVGQGLGTAALAAFLDDFFTNQGFLVMLLDVAATNERAVRSYRRLGFSVVGSDWRTADSRFDQRILNNPNYAHLRRYFRANGRGVEVEFYEMQLHKAEWLARQRRQFSH